MIDYRRGRLSDLQAIGKLHAQNFQENNGGTFTDAFLDTGLNVELLELWQERLDRPTETQFLQVAHDDTNLLGFVCVYGTHDSSWGSLIDNLHVADSARKTGVGSSLMKQAGSWLDLHYSEMAVYLFVLESNSVARRFYERLGASHPETLTMESHRGALVRNCRYSWPRPKHISAT